ncbi:MAG: hypothetical protein GY851_09940, partial [bacterium]|nr:hypothetical protein [bacterium]
MKTDTFLLQFGDNGLPAKFCTLPGKETVLDKRRTGQGFYLQEPDKKRIPLKATVNPNGDLTARSADGRLEVVFKVRVTPRYLAFRIQSVKGIPTARGTSLHFEVNANARARVTELDYMTRVQNLGYAVRVRWESIWCRSKVNPLGGFALFVANDEKEGD